MRPKNCIRSWQRNLAEACLSNHNLDPDPIDQAYKLKKSPPIIPAQCTTQHLCTPLRCAACKIHAVQCAKRNYLMHVVGFISCDGIIWFCTHSSVGHKVVSLIAVCGDSTSLSSTRIGQYIICLIASCGDGGRLFWSCITAGVDG